MPREPVPSVSWPSPVCRTRSEYFEFNRPVVSDICLSSRVREELATAVILAISSLSFLYTKMR